MSLLVFVALCLAVGAFGGAVTRPALAGWYRELRKPSWTPPARVFGPVWTVLYLLMAVAGWRLWRLEPAGAAMQLWGVQLVLNALWSYFFFALRAPGLALADIGALWLSLALLIASAAQLDPTAALLLAPYLVWITFAAALNLAIWRANRTSS